MPTRAFTHEREDTFEVFDTGSERHSGWYIGGGVDMAMSHGWTIGLEYRHYEFNSPVMLRTPQRECPSRGYAEDSIRQ